MNEEFKSLSELYDRVKPALYSKVREVHRLGFNIVSEVDIWNYLVENVWKNKTNLELFELISDILHVDNYIIYEYVMNKYKKIKEKEEVILDNDSLI